MIEDEKNQFLKQIFFPYKTVRKGQYNFLKNVDKVIKNRENLLVSAPTGLGKTISALAPAVAYAVKNNLAIIVLTSRQTQANQIAKTIKEITNNENFHKKLNVVTLIGKKNMCIHREKEEYNSSDFSSFCKNMKETGKCPYFKNIKNTDNDEIITKLLKEILTDTRTIEEFINEAKNYRLCPYELITKKLYNADIVICDYNYIFNIGIREQFFGKFNRDPSETILIIDEAHNLPSRIRNSYSSRLSTEVVFNGLNELKKHIKTKEFDTFVQSLIQTIDSIYLDKLLGNKNETLLQKEDFIKKYIAQVKKNNNNLIFDIEEIITKLLELSLIIKEDKIISYIEKIASFLNKWIIYDEENYLRLITKKISRDKTILSLELKCIDPEKISKPILNSFHSSILMSATLNPIEMYKDILGLENTKTLIIDSPFKRSNQITFIIDDVTTAYTKRGKETYTKIAKHIENILISAPDKNALIFFPSYALLNDIYSYINKNKINRIVLKEQKLMLKKDKEKFISKFKKFNDFTDIRAKALFAVTSGSFSEGLDLPNKFLEIVIVVGLPLAIPNIHTKAMIYHFDKKFKKGDLYAYIFPALNKIIQAAGRCIRTEDDKGVVALIDSRFKWPNYIKNFPPHWNIKITNNQEDYINIIKDFFNKND